MLRKLLRSSLLITLLLIVSITLSGCSIDFGAIFAGIKTFIGNISGNLGEFVSKGIDTVKGVIDTVKTVAKPVVDTAKDIFKNVKDKVDTVKDVIDKGKGVIKTGKDAVKDVIDTGKGIVKDVKDTAKGVVSDVKDTAKGIVNDVKGAIKGDKDAAKSLVKGVKEGAKDIKTAKGQLQDLGINIAEGAKDAIGNTISVVDFRADKVASRDSEEGSTVTVNPDGSINRDVTLTEEETNSAFTEWLRSLADSHKADKAVNTVSVIRDNSSLPDAPVVQAPIFIPTVEEMEVLSEREIAIVKENIKQDASNLKTSMERLINELNESELKDASDDVKADIANRLETVKSKMDDIISDPINVDRTLTMEEAADEIEKILSAAQGYSEEIEDFSDNVESILSTCEESFEGLLNNFTKVFGDSDEDDD